MDDSRIPPAVDVRDALARRRLLTPVPVAPAAPGVSTLSAAFDAGGAIDIRVRYVADRAVLSPESLPEYLSLFRGTAPEPLETLAQTILEDVTDQIIPCWIEIKLRRQDIQGGIAVAHEVRVEDRQPRWQENGVLDRLSP